MAEYNITHSCGHTKILKTYGNVPHSVFIEEERKLCLQCEQVGFNTNLYLPKLEGTDRQIEWAEKIRLEAAYELGWLMKKTEFEKEGYEVLNKFSKLKSAVWWINQRGLTAKEMLMKIINSE
ncbi:hypothetical protein [Shouchella clausii]|uniref:hypothetical protein n=1 Tax=Shouchella clausii TaxID=79880 RepID=UPI001C72C5C2|nr:hypothetical protein [Shouchella clausii]MBX0320338.1 hypothetical protein [Shouchella clausii]MEB5480898.1 hypothetical protein [Shouchella clausii]